MIKHQIGFHSSPPQHVADNIRSQIIFGQLGVWQSINDNWKHICSKMYVSINYVDINIYPLTMECNAPLSMFIWKGRNIKWQYYYYVAKRLSPTPSVGLSNCRMSPCISSWLLPWILTENQSLLLSLYLNRMGTCNLSILLSITWVGSDGPYLSHLLPFIESYIFCLQHNSLIEANH